MSKEKKEKEPEVDLIKDAVMSRITNDGHVKAMDIAAMALPLDAMTDDHEADEAAIQDAIVDLLAEKKIVRKSFGQYAGYALPHV